MESYAEFIQNIIDNRGRHGCDAEYHECHHIKPKCMGGNDDEDNLIDLFAREHFVAHQLLAKENPDNSLLLHAWWMMCQTKQSTQDRYVPMPEEYEDARIALSKTLSKSFAGSGNPMFGRRGEQSPFFGIPRSEETRRKIANALRGRSYDGEYRGSGRHSGYTHSKETKRKISESHSGSKNYNIRMVYCPELDEYFWGAKEVEEKYGIDHGNIARCCNGKYKSAGKHPITGQKLTWQYIDNSNNI
jgi:hypothetical protein